MKKSYRYISVRMCRGVRLHFEELSERRRSKSHAGGANALSFPIHQPADVTTAIYGRVLVIGLFSSIYVGFEGRK